MPLTAHRDGIFSRVTPRAAYQSQVDSFADGSLGACPGCAGLGQVGAAYPYGGSLGAVAQMPAASVARSFSKEANYQRLKHAVSRARALQIMYGTPALPAASAAFTQYKATLPQKKAVFSALTYASILEDKVLQILASHPPKGAGLAITEAFMEYEQKGLWLAGLGGAVDTQTMVLYGLGALVLAGAAYVVLSKGKRGKAG